MKLWVKLGLVGAGALATAVSLSCSSDEESGGKAGSSGSAGSAGSAGSGATGGSSGASGSGGAGGSAGSSGTGGTAGSTGTGGSGAAAANSTEPNLKVAFIGDQGAGTDARAVYQVILDEGADLTLALGDFDYQDDPDLWESDINAVLGEDYPLFGVVGNHDTDAWSGYQEKLSNRLTKITDANCSGGEIGEQHNCTFRGLRVILSGIGTMGSDSDHEDFIESSLAADPDSLWKICGWHQNQRDMQLGGKSDAIGWTAFKSCQDHAAIIAAGHEHTYGRTLTLTDVGNEANGHGATGAPDLMEVAPGRTFSFYNGLGGSSIRTYSASLHDDDTWWATMYCSNKYVKNGQPQSGGAQYGALFIEFHVDGDPSKARGYFKNIDGELVDEFTIIRN